MKPEELEQLFLHRQSCRNFSDRPLKEETLREICRLALLAPSARNAQPWKLFALTGAKKEEILPFLQRLGMNKFADKAQALVAVVGENDGERENEFIANDLGILTAHLVLAAETMGVGSCILGWRQEDELRNALGLPQGARIPVVVALGYTAEDTVRAKVRKPLSETYFRLF